MIPRQSPMSRATYMEYAIEAGGIVLSHRRYDSAYDAWFDNKP